jgi:uncharacterized Zn finger protein
MAPALASLLTHGSLRKLAGDVTFARGEEYFESGCVWKLEASNESVEARVRGTRDYRVRIWREGKRVHGSCTCPAAEDMAFCKHAVAAALAVSAGGTGPATDRKERSPALTRDDVQKHLGSMEKDDLVDLLMRQAVGDVRLSRQLFLLAAKQRKAGPDLATFRRSIDSALATDGFVDYEAFPTRTDWRLREFVVQEYQRLGRREDALALVWDAFVDAPHVAMYEELAAHAKRAKCWPPWRERALALVRTSIQEENRERRLERWPRTADHSDLVQIFLWEKDTAAAWAEAKAGGCTNELWLALAGLREKDHPEDALPIYRAQVEPSLGRRNGEGYTHAIR